MHVEVIATGDEVLHGAVVNGNAASLARKLHAQGVLVERHTAVSDTLEDIVAAVQEALVRAARHAPGAIVVSGGLGPTEDDRTTAAIAQALGVELFEDRSSAEAIRAFFAGRGVKMPAQNLKQALFPVGAAVIPNPMGTAPAYVVRQGATAIYALPGVPREWEYLCSEVLVPEIVAAGGRRTTASLVLRAFGVGESHLEAELGDLPSRHPQVVIGYRAAFPEIHLRLRATADSVDQARRLVEAAREDILATAGTEVIFGEDDDSLPVVVGKLLRQHQMKLAVAESCTGGLVGDLLTDVPGSSDYFIGGVVAYSNSVKQRLLMVPEDLLGSHGAVSEETVRAMAEGVRRALDADLGVAVSGIAGPAGGTKEKPVGTVHLAVVDARGGSLHKRVSFKADRAMVKRLAAFWALELVRRHLEAM